MTPSISLRTRSAASLQRVGSECSQRLAMAAAGALLSLALALPAGAQAAGDEFRWSGEVASGRTLHLRNMNGAVRMEAGTGRQVEVVARKRYRRGDPRSVEVEVQRTGSGQGDVLVCAVWEGGRCDVNNYRGRREGRWNSDNDVAVEFTVRVPAGVRLDVSTVNGELRITGATDRVDLRTVNGSITGNSSGGPVTAQTVNGSITVRMGASGSNDLNYKTVNGSITVEIPEGLSADVDMSTVNGRIESDFPLTVQGRINPRHIRATIGSGGRTLRASTVNGSVSIRRVEGRG